MVTKASASQCQYHHHYYQNCDHYHYTISDSITANLKWNRKESDDDIGERKVGDEEVGHRLKLGDV